MRIYAKLELLASHRGFKCCLNCFEEAKYYSVTYLDIGHRLRHTFRLYTMNAEIMRSLGRHGRRAFSTDICQSYKLLPIQEKKELDDLVTTNIE